MAQELTSEPRKTSNTGQVVQVTMQVNGQILRAEEASSDMFAAVDAVVEKLERSVERYKSKLYRKDDIRRCSQLIIDISPAGRKSDCSTELFETDVQPNGVTGYHLALEPHLVHSGKKRQTPAKCIAF